MVRINPLLIVRLKGRVSLIEYRRLLPIIMNKLGNRATGRKLHRNLSLAQMQNQKMVRMRP